ncbi:cysteine hydrolase family protein [Streptomyces sp. ADMS]|uniref:cysteine hydrolase family protein n=1 Tax=Streptomyces sp. ADMS TaxID=3071415 RepID=UPI0039916DB5
MLTKTSFGAFATTDLRELLEAAGVGRIVVAGVATSGTVLSTTRWAVDTGYRHRLRRRLRRPRPPGQRPAARRVGRPEELGRAVARRRRPAGGRDPRAAPVT